MNVNKESMIDLFDSAALDFANSLIKYGDDSIVTNGYRNQLFGISRAIRRAGIIDQETLFKIIDCLYAVI